MQEPSWSHHHSPGAGGGRLSPLWRRLGSTRSRSGSGGTIRRSPNRPYAGAKAAISRVGSPSSTHRPGIGGWGRPAPAPPPAGLRNRLAPDTPYFDPAQLPADLFRAKLPLRLVLLMAGIKFPFRKVGEENRPGQGHTPSTLLCFRLSPHKFNRYFRRFFRYRLRALPSWQH